MQLFKKHLSLFTKFKTVQALLFLAIPLILILVNGTPTLKSISAYVNYTPVAFSFMLTMAGSLFIYDSVVDKKSPYNSFIGVSLFGVVLFNHLVFPILHYSFAIIFFIGSLFNMIFFSSNSQRPLKILTAVAVLFGMLGCFYFNWYSIFWAEWVGMVPISLHFVLEELGKID